MSTERLVGLVSDERIAQEIVVERLALNYLHSVDSANSILTPDDIADEVVSSMFDDIDAIDQRNAAHSFPSAWLNERLTALPDHIEIPEIPPFLPTRTKTTLTPSFSETVATILNLTDDTPKEFFKAFPRNVKEEIVYSTGKVAGAIRVTAEGLSDELEGNSRKLGAIAATAAVLITGVSALSPNQNAGANELKLSYNKTSVSVPFDTTSQDKTQSIIAAAEAADVSPDTITIKDGTLRFTDSRLLDKGQRDAVVAGTFAAMAPDASHDSNPITSEQPVSEAPKALEVIVSPEVQAVNAAIAEVKLGQNNNLDSLIQAIKNMDVAFIPFDKDRVSGMPAGYVKMLLPNEAVGIAVPYTVAERTADKERYTSPAMAATLYATAKLHQDLILQKYPELAGQMLRLRDLNSPNHMTHNDGRQADISGALGWGVEQYADGAFADHAFSPNFNMSFTEDMAIEMSRLFTAGSPAISSILVTNPEMISDVNAVVGRRFLIDHKYHEDHFHVTLRKDLAEPQWRVTADKLPWNTDQDLRVGDMAQSITLEQHASEHADFESWIDSLGLTEKAPPPNIPEAPVELEMPESFENIELLSPEAQKYIDNLDLTNSQKNFLKKMMPSIVTVYRSGAKINPIVVLAQTSLETGFGQDKLSPAANNFFGIKAGRNWGGDVYDTKTQEEYTAGSIVTITDGFRKYPNAASSVADYARLIQSRSHYADAVENYTSIEGYTNGLFNEVDNNGNIIKAQGEEGVMSYGTDRGYEQKVFKVISDYGYEELINLQLDQIPKTTTTTTQDSKTTTTMAENTEDKVSTEVTTTTGAQLPETDITTTTLTNSTNTSDQKTQGTDAWISRDAALKAFRVYFTANGVTDEEALKVWVDELKVNDQGKLRVNIYETPDVAKEDK